MITLKISCKLLTRKDIGSIEKLLYIILRNTCNGVSPLTSFEYSLLLGVHVATITRALKNLRSAGLIKTIRPSIGKKLQIDFIAS